MKKSLLSKISVIMSLSLAFSVMPGAGYGIYAAAPEDYHSFTADTQINSEEGRIFEDDSEYYREYYSEDYISEHRYDEGPQPDGNGTLTFGEKEVPVAGYIRRDDIKKIVFTAGIKNIKKRAFMGCKNLEEVVFPEDNTLKYIYKSAFEDCTSLKRFICPDTKMDGEQHSGIECEDRILYGDSALEEIKLGAGLWHFGRDSFYKAEKLKSVTLPEDLHNINGNIFRGCTNLTSIEISDKNPYFLSHEGALYEKLNPYLGTNNDMPVPILYAVPTGKIRDNGGTFVCAKNVVMIGPMAFLGDSALKRAVFSRGSMRIGRNAFEGCTNLDTVVWPRSIKLVGQEAFLSCNSLKHILYTGTEDDWKKVQVEKYKHGTRGDNHTYFVEDRLPLDGNKEVACLTTNTQITFEYDNTEQSTDDAADWEGVTITGAWSTFAAGSKFDAGAFLGTRGKKGYKYESSNKGYVKVSGKGIATVKKGSGEVTITAKNKKDNNDVKEMKITIESPVMKKSHAASAGDVIYANTGFISEHIGDPVWISSKPEVAEINEETGKITCKGSGKVKIYAVFNGTGLKDKNGTRKKYKTTLKVN